MEPSTAQVLFSIVFGLVVGLIDFSAKAAIVAAAACFVIKRFSRLN